MEQLDVLEGGYIPAGWGTVEGQQQAILQGAQELLAGTRTLKVEIAPTNTVPTNIRPLKSDTDKA